MTKARTLADFISDGSPLADGTISVSEVSGAAPLASPTFTGAVTSPQINLVNPNNSGKVLVLDVDQGDVISVGDLEIYDDRTSGIGYMLRTDTSTQAIGADAVVIMDRTGQKSLANFAYSGDTGTAKLRYWDSNGGYDKLETSLAGISVVGTVTADGLTVGGSATFNEGGADADFRVESDGNSSMFVVDAAADQVRIGQGSSSVPSSVAKLYVKDGVTTDYSGQFTMSFQGGNYYNYYKGMTGLDLSTSVARGLHLFNYDSDSDAGINFWSGRPTVGTPVIMATFGPSNTIFNDGGVDRDFRVESDAYSHALFVDASTNRISLGGSGAEPNATVGIFSTTSGEPLLRLAGTTNGEVITQRFQGANTSGTLKFGDISFVPNAEEINFRPIWNGSNMFTIQPSESTFNQDGLSSHDFRVESDSNSNALKVDAGYNSGKGAVIVGSNSAPTTGVDYNIAASMLKFSDAQPIMATGTTWNFPSVPSNRQTQAHRWRFQGFTMPYHSSDGYRADTSYAQFVIELPNGGQSGQSNLEIFEIGFNYGWSGGFYMVELYENYYTNSGYKRYQFDGGYNPSFNLHQNYGNNSIALNVLSEGTFQDGTSSVPSNATDGSYYRKTVRASYPAYRGGMVVLTVPSWYELTPNAAEVDNGGKIRLLNPQ